MSTIITRRSVMSSTNEENRVDTLIERLRCCDICPRLCRVDRHATTGFCKAPAELIVASAGPHFGEEAPLVGRGGSGTIFLAGCNLQCVFCQNYDISHTVSGQGTETGRLADQMLGLERSGCVNVNFVTPSHYAPQLMQGVIEARRRGLAVPIVYNSSGYDLATTLREIDGLVDIYMPDVKFFDADACATYLHARDYPERAREALVEMHRQVGDLEAVGGVARRGVLVRHLVMPDYGEDTRAILKFLAEEISPDTYVNVMGQYRPCFEAGRFARIATYPSQLEIASAKRFARELGLRLNR